MRERALPQTMYVRKTTRFNQRIDPNYVVHYDVRKFWHFVTQNVISQGAARTVDPSILSYLLLS